MIDDETDEISPIVLLMASMAITASLVTVCTAPIWLAISS